MKSIRRIGALLFVLFIGIFIGTLGWKSAVLVIMPLFILWLMLWDENRYRRFLKRQQRYYFFRDQH